ncbi:Altered inheritance of mitochondria protein 18 mitochondrial [Mortierella claussenii]|nr:Altered inheritance of mitochondria protein 18 mitochondrial [Mortierella claussenii]
MSAAARMTRMRTLAVQQPIRNAAFAPATMRAPIHRHLGRVAAATTTTRSQDRWRPWMMASIATAGVISWQLATSTVEAESAVKSNTVVDPDSKAVFPLYISANDGSPARLLGLGVRKITFLGIQVYSVGLYGKVSDLDDHNSRFRALPEVQKFQRTDQASADTAFRAMVTTPIELILRIAPVKNTNGPHLRDGFTRNLTQAAKDQKLSETDNAAAMEGILQFKNMFPKSKIGTDQALLFRKSPDGSMTIQLDDEVLGTIHNQWVIETFFFGYLQGENPISPSARDSIADGIQNLLLQ